MIIKPFGVEEWMNEWEDRCDFNIAETCVDSITLDELFKMADIDKNQFWSDFTQRRMTYGDITGRPDLLKGISSLYKTIKTDEIVPTHGAAGANHLVISAIVNAGDHVVSVIPTYQQLYSIPEAIGGKVDLLHLEKEEGYLPNIEKLDKLVTPDTKLICINNPNNPTGALMDEEMLRQIVDIARKNDAYLLCDEVYRHLTQDDVYQVSIADMYEKGISVSSMSKAFSLAGIRLGWCATHDADLRRALLSHRDYSTISCGLFDEHIGAIALNVKDQLLARSKKLARENLEYLAAWVTREPHISYVTPKAGTITLLSYDFDIPSEEFALRLLTDTGAMVVPGSAFEEEHTFRIGYCNNRKSLVEGLGKISEWMKTL